MSGWRNPPFSAERAAEIWAKRGLQNTIPDSAMTTAERDFVKEVWDAIPRGTSCWMDAFFLILNNQLDRVTPGANYWPNRTPTS